MVVFEDLDYEANYSPVEDEDEWETVYPSEYEEAQEEEVKPPEENNTSFGGKTDDMERLMWIADVLNDGHVKGYGNGVEVAGVVAALLENAKQYEFEFSFVRLNS